VCSSLCTIVAHNIAQNRPDNFPSYPPDNHHCSDDVYLREGGGVEIDGDVAGDGGVHSLANWDCCPTPAKSEAIEYLQVGPTEIRYSIAWTIFVYL